MKEVQGDKGGREEGMEGGTSGIDSAAAKEADGRNGGGAEKGLVVRGGGADGGAVGGGNDGLLGGEGRNPIPNASRGHRD